MNGYQGVASTASATASASTGIVPVVHTGGVGAESCPAQWALTMPAVSGVMIPTPTAINEQMPRHLSARA